MQPLLKQAVNAGIGEGLSSGGSLFLPRRSGAADLHFTVTPFKGLHVFGTPRVAAMVFVSDPARNPISRALVMKALYQLTPAETRVTELLLQGLDIAQLAERANITLETGRLYVKRILSKTGTRRQSELMKLMMSLPGTVGLGK